VVCWQNSLFLLEGLQLIRWGPSTIWRIVCITQSTELNVKSLLSITKHTGAAVQPRSHLKLTIAGLLLPSVTIVEEGLWHQEGGESPQGTKEGHTHLLYITYHRSCWMVFMENSQHGAWVFLRKLYTMAKKQPFYCATHILRGLWSFGGCGLLRNMKTCRRPREKLETRDGRQGLPPIHHATIQLWMDSVLRHVEMTAAGFCLFVWFCHCVAQAGLKLMIFLPQPPECWDYRYQHAMPRAVFAKPGSELWN
jgi:hypothetical protein